LVLAAAGGALTVSIALLQRQSSGFGGLQAAFLFGGWILEVIAILLVLRSLYQSEAALWKERERIDCMLQGTDDPGWSNPASDRTEWSNIAAAGCTIIGIVALLAEAAIGLAVMSGTSR
jgi:hypothetical protein